MEARGCRHAIHFAQSGSPQTKPAYAKQRIGTLTPAGPVRVATGINDNLVPHEQARNLALDWCRLGCDVTYEPVKLPNLGEALLNHFGPLLTDQEPAIDWFADRLAGQPTRSNCPTTPSQP